MNLTLRRWKNGKKLITLSTLRCMSSGSVVRTSVARLAKLRSAALSVVMCYGICAAADFWYTHYTVRRDWLVFRMLIDRRIM